MHQCQELPPPARLSAAGAAGVRLEAHPLSHCSWGVARAAAVPAFGAASSWPGVWFSFVSTVQVSMIQHSHFGQDLLIGFTAGADVRSIILRVSHLQAWLWPKRVMLRMLKLHLQLLGPRFLK